MVHLSKPLRLLSILALSTTTTTAFPTANIFTRQQNTCAADNLISCSSDLPDNFCCPTGTKCNSLAGDTTIICCPDGQDCQTIRPVTCSIEQQDADENPLAPIKTTVFDVDLPKCGRQTCCPFGYTCNDAGLCEQDEDQSEKPKQDESSPTTSVSEPTSEPTAEVPTTLEPSVQPTTDPGSATTTGSETSPPSTTSTSDESQQDNSSSGPDLATILGSVIGGCGILLIIAIILFICLRRRNRRTVNTSNKTTRGKIISDPILQTNNNYSHRTDFIRKPNTSETDSRRTTRFPINPSSSNPPRISIPNPFESPNPSGHSPPASRASSIGDDSAFRTGQVHSGGRLAPIRAMKASSRHLTPTTPQMQRQQSGESINVFADPGTVERNEDRFTRQTTFTEMMDQASLGDVHRGKAYVPGATPRI